jgi:hypothetical protein
MAQVTLYLDSRTDRQLAQAAKGAKLSKSRYVAELIRQKSAGQWPPEFLKLAGAYPDFPTADEVRASLGSDLPRVPLD